MKKEDRDAQGRAIYDYFMTRQKIFETVERDDGYIDTSSGPDTYLSTYKDWPAHHKKAMELVRGRILDIGCGAGRHALYLQNKGYDVLGIDISPHALKVCRKRGLKKVMLMSIDQISKRIGIFDTVLMMGNNFGLFENQEKAKRLLLKLHRITSSRGRIIAETLDPYQTTNLDHLRYQNQNRRKGRMSGQIRIRIRYRTYKTDWFNYLFVSKDEMSKILKGTGWRIKKIIRSKNPQYIAVIEKKQQPIH